MTETAGRSSDLALTAPARMDPALLDDLLADGPSLRYVSQWHDQASAVLEFEADLGGVYVQGVDILRWNAEGNWWGRALRGVL